MAFAPIGLKIDTQVQTDVPYVTRLRVPYVRRRQVRRVLRQLPQVPGPPGLTVGGLDLDENQGDW